MLDEIHLCGQMSRLDLVPGTLTVVCDGQSLVFPIAQQEAPPAPPRQARAQRAEGAPAPKPPRTAAAETSESAAD